MHEGLQQEYPGGVTVTDTEIITPTEVIPRFAAQPTIVASRTGAWSDPTIWSTGHVPTEGDRVLVPAARIVVYASQNDARINALEVAGVMVFSSTTSTRLVVGTLTVMPTGMLQIGNPDFPVAAQATAELIIADRALDLVNDPRQYGTGLIVLGKLLIHGAPLTRTWTQLAGEAKAGDTWLTVSQPDAAWQPGDTLVLPDTRQVPTTKIEEFMDGQFPPQWEEITIDHVADSRVYLTEPLAFDHLGARDSVGLLRLRPHVANLDRNVIIRSENPAGTRGHVIFVARANIDIRYARFQDLGRTDALRKLDNTTFDEAGNLTHVGTNQIGRYSVHAHHLLGPVNPSNTDYQFRFVGNTVDGAMKWAVAVHDSSYGLIDKNVVYDAQGAGFVTEEGSEVLNLFRDNITIRVVGTMVDGKPGTKEGDYGRGGSGFWFRRGGNFVIGNVAADSSFAGFVFDGYFLPPTVTLPLFRGADPHHPGQGYTTKLVGPTLMAHNEAYGLSAHGLWAAYISGDNLPPNQPLVLITNLRVWNVFSAGVYMYHTSNATFRYLTIYGNRSAQDRNDIGASGMNLTKYENRDLVIRDSLIEGMRFGIQAPRRDASKAGLERPTLIERSTLKNYINILVAPAWDFGSSGTSLIVRDVNFKLLTLLPQSPSNPASIAPPANIYMALKAGDSNLTQPVVVKVYNYNRIVGDDFQVLFHEQAPTFVMPPTDPALLGSREPGIVGSPQAGITNQTNWIFNGITVSGLLAPSTAITRLGINGLVIPLVDTSAIAPSVALVTPWNGATVNNGAYVRVRYNVYGQLPAGASVWFSLDGGTPVGPYQDGGLFAVPPGAHRLLAWIGDSTGRQVLGTTGDSASFTIGSGSAASVATEAAAPRGEPTILAPQYAAISTALANQVEVGTAAREMNTAGTAAEAQPAPNVAAMIAAPKPAMHQAERTAAQPVAPTTMAVDDVLGDGIDEGLLGQLAIDIARSGPSV